MNLACFNPRGFDSVKCCFGCSSMLHQRVSSVEHKLQHQETHVKVKGELKIHPEVLWERRPSQTKIGGKLQLISEDRAEKIAQHALKHAKLIYFRGQKLEFWGPQPS